MHTVAVGDGLAAKREGAKIKQVYNAELFAAIKETEIKTWSKNSLHLYFCIFVSFCCACANGYDGSLMTAINAMKPFQDVFHVGTTGSKLSVVTSLYAVGSMVFFPVSATISDKLGRRKCMFVGAWIIILGSILTASGHSYGQFVFGRFVLGCGIQVMVVSAPAYAVEISPPLWRGRAVGFYNCGWFGGSIPAAAITYGTNNITNNWSWRIPLILQCFTCLIVIVSIWFIPESPRWLLTHGREEEALAFLAKYHGNGDPNARLVQLEIGEMREGIRQDGIDKRWWDYRPFFLTHSGRWRFIQVLMISIFGQWSGNGLGYFNTSLYSIMGYTSSGTQLLLNLVTQIVQAAGALAAVTLSDKMPRRKVLVPGTFGCAVCMCVFAAVALPLTKTGSLSHTRAQTSIAFYYLFNVVYGFTYTPLQGIIPAEALETTTRAKGLALSGFIVSLISFINQFASPIGLQNLQTNYIWIFVGWDVFESACWYLFCVEAQGRTIEELEWIYQQPNPVKASKHVDKVVVQNDGRVLEKIEDD
ncbi:hypothetical protein OIDMADRAFT_165310 [Oidiodendron maius Zn]|uniref:Major facilitator superfamily (MFS) profile domain-containing protein n=1 Tax=Oidiodendron maius (strain Zn) TaxID=913774 RepID=A0A0C3DFD4_OIDMZ|nr:hypothetical protein OIDMADRAFT_165310 [Oidiodendron maius Zn]